MSLRLPLLSVIFIFLLGLIPALADSILFIGNSFTFGAEAPLVHANGGVPKLFEEIARTKGRQVTTFAVTHPGATWAFHLARPITANALNMGPWTWVVLQDESTAPTRIGSVSDFLRDGETFSDRIARNSPRTGIVLYETWARPAGLFYFLRPGRLLGSPAEMMCELHQSYAQLQGDLVTRNPARPVRVAPVGTAFARVGTGNPEINLNARDRHHATTDGYYLAALVIYETIYHDSARGAPASFFDGRVVIPGGDAAALQAVADQVMEARLVPER